MQRWLAIISACFGPAQSRQPPLSYQCPSKHEIHICRALTQTFGSSCLPALPSFSHLVRLVVRPFPHPSAFGEVVSYAPFTGVIPFYSFAQLSASVVPPLRLSRSHSLPSPKMGSIDVLCIILLYYTIHFALFRPHNNHDFYFNAAWYNIGVDRYGDQAEPLHQVPGFPQKLDAHGSWQQDDDETLSTATTVVSPDVDGEGLLSLNGDSILSGDGEVVLPVDGDRQEGVWFAGRYL
ncbi:hypothetical protein B0J13DRAFT_571185 [Dactylonectria estremocensis]|uniref:Uncharacterized protein n=1 Tax=Dactylonectria estremocensis TaxID=1079267 RepID=A0A9P9DEH6_9HYPO|nr:hypothetical protein B0J13DRAFT_571185 [Dactylonectria estremocensis]